MISKTERNIWKQNNIPPLEYCSISRAQKLLDCEIEDLLHWHDIGAINLCVKLTSITGTLNIALTQNKESINKRSLYSVNQSDTLKKNEATWSYYSRVDRVLELKDSVSAIETQQGNHAIQIKLKAIVSGLWYVTSKNLGELLECPEHNHLAKEVSAINPANNTLFCLFSPDNSSNLPISINKIYIISKDVEKIYEHTISSRPLELAREPTIILNKKIINEPQFTLQNKTLTDFIDEFMKLNPELDKKSLYVNENLDV